MDNIKNAVSGFINHCHYEKNLSSKTLKAYQIDLGQLQDFLNRKRYSQNISEIPKNILKEYIQEISGFKPKTVKRKIATIKAMFNFLEFEDKLKSNPFRKMKIQIREPRVLPNVMNLSEVAGILQSTYELRRGLHKTSYAYAESIRNMAVVELLFATGVRVSELSGLKQEHVDLNSGLIKVKGKGNKERIIQVCHSESLNALRQYKKVFGSRINDCGYFFVNRFNQKLSEQSIRFLVKRIAKRTGVTRVITPHAFRHSFATLLLEKDVDIKYIQHLLGHSSIATTQIYTHVNAEKQRQILQKHPRRLISLS